MIQEAELLQQWIIFGKKIENVIKLSCTLQEISTLSESWILSEEPIAVSPWYRYFEHYIAF